MFKTRWKGKSKKQVSEAMRALALKSYEGMTAQQLSDRMKARAKKRGKRTVRNGVISYGK